MNLRKLISTLSILGPAVLVSVELFDPASIVAATASGARHGFDVLWAAFYSGVLLIVIQEISARLGVVTGRTLAESIHERYGKRYSLLLFGTLLLLGFATLTAEVMGLSLVVSYMFRIPYALAVTASILVTSFLVYRVPYDRLEKVIILLVTMIFFAYLYFVFDLNVSVADIAFHSLVPSFDRNTFYYAESVIGASIMPTYVVLHSGLVFEKGWAHHHEKGIEELVEQEDKHVVSERVDSAVSLLMGTLLNIVVIASAAILMRGNDVSDFSDIALPFYNKLGDIGLVLFATAFACAGISAVITVGLGNIYCSFGLLGSEERIRKKGFRVAFIVSLVVAGFASLLPNQIEIMVFTQYLNGALLPFVIVPLILLARDAKVMGRHKLGTASIAAASTVIVITTSLFFFGVI